MLPTMFNVKDMCKLQCRWPMCERPATCWVDMSSAISMFENLFFLHTWIMLRLGMNDVVRWDGFHELHNMPRVKMIRISLIIHTT